MDTERNGRQASEAPTSSSSDFYGTAIPTLKQQGDTPFASTAATNTNGSLLPQGTTHGDDDEGDLSSEMDMSDVSSQSSGPFPGPKIMPYLTLKRKLSDAEMSQNGHANGVEEPAKKPRMIAPPSVSASNLPTTAAWPAELWQHVFVQLPPAMLARCLRVCKNFNLYLTQLKPSPASKRSRDLVRILDSEMVWVTSRKSAYPAIPKPLQPFSEPRMLQLIGGQTCQFCGKVPAGARARGPFNAGPGPNGLRIIWPFGIRTCGSCLASNTLTDIQVLGSSAGHLLQGLPYALCTPDMHYVPEHVRQTGGIPKGLYLKKLYFKGHLDTIMEDFEDAKGLGDGAAEEWRKGLITRGNELRADALRWEKSEGSIGFGTNLGEYLRKYDASSFPDPKAGQQQSKSAVSVNTTPAAPPPTHGIHPLPQPVHVFPRSGDTPTSQGSQLQYPHMQQIHRPVRSAQDVEIVRQARRADIERRCMELEPSIPPSVLRHIEAFKASLQISQPMTDGAWAMLKPRILVEREKAELTEHQKSQQMAALMAAMPPTMLDMSFTRPGKEGYDREYEQAQEPLRLKLAEYADDRINGHWHRGLGLEHDSCPFFAVDVLEHVRERYDKDQVAGILPRSQDPKHPSFLSLDNMKWVQDNKIRKFTDMLAREIFLCEGCADEKDKHPKWFAFEGLIQHYGAKHTSDFSKGNVVVHWQTAEWPEFPPFHTDPSYWIRKSNGKAKRPRNTQHGPHDPSLHTSTQGANLADLVPFQNHHQQEMTAPGHDGYDGPAATGYTPSNYPDTDAQLQRLSTDVKDVWDSLDGVKNMMECVRVQTVLHHVTSRFNDQFTLKPSLDLFINAIGADEGLRFIKNATGLACKLCVVAQTDGSASYSSYYQRIRNVKLYNASSLMTHFKIVHQEQHLWYGPYDWDKQMIELPEHQLVRELVSAPGMDDAKLALIAAAFPLTFPTPLPKIGVIMEQAPTSGPESATHRILERATKKSSKKKKTQTQVNGRDGSSEPLPEAKEDEYDPRRPTVVQKQETQLEMSKYDTDIARMAKFDTDVSRKLEAQKKPVASHSTPAFDLAPETLAALNNIATNVRIKQESPPVAQADLWTQVQALATTAAPATTTGVAPDIAAILATLTGHVQATHSISTPVAPSPYGSSGTPRHQHDPYTQPAAAFVRAESHRPSSRFVPLPPSSAEPIPVPAAIDQDHQDLRAVLSRNSGHYAQNAHHAYVEATAQPYGPPPQQRSPPRYHYAPEDDMAYRRPQPTTYVDHNGQYVQYVSMPENPAPVQYRYEQRPPPPQYYQPPPQQVRYVDEYGRQVELIPIVDSAPAPVQYAPHPYDQQQQGYGRQVYSAAPQQSGAPGPGYYEDSRVRYVYDHPHADDDRGSVPRA